MTEAKIQRDMLIGDAVGRYPEIAEILMDEGVHCVGCGAATFETLEQGLAGHGHSDEQIDALIKKMNEFIDEAPSETSEEIIITSDAAKRVKDLTEKEGKAGFGMRIKVIPGGCSGFSYTFDFENQKNEDDQIIEIDEIKFYIDEFTASMIKGSTVDFKETLAGGGFKVQNPHASSTCGCGESFS